jgi:hypothetical protein
VESEPNNRANTFCGGWAILILSLMAGFFDLVVSFLITPLAHPVHQETFVPIWFFIPSIAMAIIAGKYLQIASPFKSAFMTGLGSLSIVISILGLFLIFPAIKSETHITLIRLNNEPPRASTVR